MDELDAALPMALADAKPWWTSRTILAALAVVLSQLLALVGLAVDAPTLVDLLSALVGTVGGAVAIWGRLKAVQPIGG